MSDPTNQIHLCLVSHTNVGKTALARTLLGQDVGDVQDAAHVTQTAERHSLLATGQGDELVLWDTPGFGDSVRLYKRLSGASKPLVGFLTRVWDRWTDQPFYLSQRAMLAARDSADVVLYLVNATETPEDAGYVRPELQILKWIGKPVIVLLNQVGRSQSPEVEASEVAQWAQHLRQDASVKSVLSLDAFARCWVHEAVLFDEVGLYLPDPKKPSYQRLVDQWQRRNLERFEKSMQVISQQLLAVAKRVEAEDSGWIASWARSKFTASVAGGKDLDKQMGQSQREIAGRLLQLHGLTGSTNQQYFHKLDQLALEVDEPTSATQAGVIGAITSGAATGLGADLMSGGLTLGVGALVGAVVGGLTFAGAAIAANKVRGVEKRTIRLSDQAMEALLKLSILKYLAIAHFGRARGDYVHEDFPAVWQTLVAAAVRDRSEELRVFWAGPVDSTSTVDPLPSLAGLTSLITLSVLAKLYPKAKLATAG